MPDEWALEIELRGSVVHASGAITPDTVSLITVAIGFLRSWGTPEITVELSAVQGIDRASAQLLAQAQRSATADDWRLAFVPELHSNPH